MERWETGICLHLGDEILESIWVGMINRSVDCFTSRGFDVAEVVNCSMHEGRRLAAAHARTYVAVGIEDKGVGLMKEKGLNRKYSKNN